MTYFADFMLWYSIYYSDLFVNALLGDLIMFCIFVFT